MEDNASGLKNRTPFQTNQRVSTLSPILDTYAGPQYEYGAFDDSKLPANDIGLIPDNREEGDRPERRRK